MKTYKVVMNPANVSVTGQNNFHVLRSDFQTDLKTEVLVDGLSKADADKFKAELTAKAPLSSALLNGLVADYIRNGNCWAHLWFEDKSFNFLSAEERRYCIDKAVSVKKDMVNFSEGLDHLEKSHP